MSAGKLSLVGASFAAGALVGAALSRRPRKSARPRRVFKLCRRGELASFVKGGHVYSSLDAADGFVHLSDSTSVRKVAAAFFKDCADLVLLEIDSWKFELDGCEWARDAGAPDAAQAPTAALARCGSANTARLVHYLFRHGCVHLYSTAGAAAAATACPMGMVVRQAEVPLVGAEHAFPEWLPPGDAPAA